MEPVQETSNGNLGLKIMFVVLFLVLVGELVYFFYIVPNKKIATNVVPTILPTRVPTLTPTLIPLTPTNPPTPVSLTAFPAKQEFQGKIIELDVFKVAQTSESGIGFSFKLEVNKEPIVFFFDKNKLSYIKVIDPSGKIISYKDLKIGQNIRLNNNLGKIDIFN